MVRLQETLGSRFCLFVRGSPAHSMCPNSLEDSLRDGKACSSACRSHPVVYFPLHTVPQGVWGPQGWVGEQWLRDDVMVSLVHKAASPGLGLQPLPLRPGSRPAASSQGEFPVLKKAGPGKLGTKAPEGEPRRCQEAQE